MARRMQPTLQNSQPPEMKEGGERERERRLCGKGVEREGKVGEGSDGNKGKGGRGWEAASRQEGGKGRG